MPITQPAKTSLRQRSDSSSAVSAPRVSVVIPTHNRAELVGRAIWSVLAQTMGNFELIVVDDGSTDSTASALASVTDLRVQTIRLPGNSGVSRARNAAIARARGEWVAFLDDDDEWLPGKLAAQLERADAGDDQRTSAVYCAFTVISPDGTSLPPGASYMPEGQILRDLYRPDQIVSPSTYMVKRRVLFEAGGFDESFEAAEDRDLWLRIVKAGHCVVAVGEPLVVIHRTHTSRMTMDAVLLTRGLARYHRRWDRLSRDVLSRDTSAAVLENRRRMLERLHRKHVKRLLRSGNRHRAWRYVVAMTPVLRTYRWVWPFVGRAIAVVTLGQYAERLVGLPQRTERRSVQAQHAEVEVDGA